MLETLPEEGREGKDLQRLRFEVGVKVKECVLGADGRDFRNDGLEVNEKNVEDEEELERSHEVCG